MHSSASNRTTTPLGIPAASSERLMVWSALRATAFFVGTVVGGGVFALPAVSARAGFPIAFAWLVVVGATILLLHLMYGEIILRTPQRHRLPGYARWYLGTWGWRWGMTSALVSALGGLLIYLILLGQFASHLLISFPISQALPPLLLWVPLVVAVAAGLRAVAKAELFLSAALIALMVGISLFGLFRLRPEHLGALGSLRDVALPYGVLMFALSGTIAVPEIREFFSQNTPWFQRSIIAGTVLPAALYGLFIISIVGAFGGEVSEDLFATVKPFGAAVQYGLALFGVLAVASSFLAVATYLVDTLRYDLRLRRSLALSFLAVPLILYVLGARDFMVLVAFVGILLGFLDGSLILLLWTRAKRYGSVKPWYAVPLPAKTAYVMMGMLLFGTLAAFSSVF